MTTITEFAPAKVNLTVRVLGRRADGYHELDSIVAFPRDVGDVITLTPGVPVHVSVSGPFGATIAGENLVTATLARLARAEPRLALGAVHLEKNLPVAAGIGGGSADAAAVLRAVRQANPSFRDRFDWLGVAADLGADVPVCFVGRRAWMTGTGTTVQPLKAKPELHAIVANPQVLMPADKTAQVFRALNAPPLAVDDAPGVTPPGPFATRAALLDEMARVGNALRPAAERVVPEIGTVRQALAALPGCRFAEMSGAGPTCFAVFDDASSAAAAAQALQAARPGWWVRAVTLG